MRDQRGEQVQGRRDTDTEQTDRRGAQDGPGRRESRETPARATETRGRPTAGAETTVLADRLRDEIGTEAFERYLGRGARLDLRDDELCVTVASRFAADVIHDRFGDALRRAMSACCPERDLPIRFDICPVRPGGAQTPRATTHTRPSGGSRADHEQPCRRVRRTRSEADPRTFESFMVGASNRLAVEAARRIAEDESAEVSCPCFIYGPCGVGKSHVLAAIAAQFARTYSGARVKCVSAEAFTNEYIRAVRTDRVEAFHRVYRRIDLLCLDDVHFLAKKSGTQTELLHTFDALDLSGARVVLASDNHPRQIKPFSEALVSRFVSGSVAMIDMPDEALRHRLVRSFADRAGLRLAGGVAEMLADGAAGDGPCGSPSVRDLLGMVNKTLAFARMHGVRTAGVVDAAAAAAVLRSSSRADDGEGAGRPMRPVPIDRILDTVCATLSVTRAEMAGRGRAKAVVLARAMVAWLARRLTRRSYPEIAEAMGRSNHSTIITAHKRIEGQIERGERVAAGLHYDGLPIATLAERIERTLRGG